MSIFMTIGQCEQKLFFKVLQVRGKGKERIILERNIIVTTFVTEVTKYLCSGWNFFLQTNFDFLTKNF